MPLTKSFPRQSQRLRIHELPQDSHARLTASMGERAAQGEGRGYVGEAQKEGRG